MTLRRFLRSGFGHRDPLSPSSHRTSTTPLRFEPLESRCLLSASPLGNLGDFATQGDGIVEYHAVICGIANYYGTGNDLRYSDDDARDFRAALLEGNNWESENITMLIDAQVTEPAVQQAISQMAAAADADDVCVFFFSGHGTRTSDTAPMDESDGYDEALCVYSWSQSILDDELSDWIGALPTDKFAVIIDTCYSGGQIKSSGAKGIGGALGDEGDGFAADFLQGDTKDLEDLGHGVVLTACRESEYSVEGSTWGNGVFTYYLVKGMAKWYDTDQDGAVSVEESFDYLESRVTQAESSQHPMKFDGHAGDLCLVRYSEGFIFSDAESLVTSEDGDTATFGVALTSAPLADVTVTLQTNDASEGDVAPHSLTFTPADWNAPQSVTVTGADDILDDDDVVFSLHLAAASSDPAFDGATRSVTCTNEDNDEPIPADFPFTEDFSAGAIPMESWGYYSTGDGRIQIVSGALRMDSSVDNTYVLNEAVLHVDLSQWQGVVLAFDHESPSGDGQFDDGDLTVGTLFTDSHRNADIVSFSDDGRTWCVLHLLDESGSFEFDLDPAVAAAGMAFSSDFQIKFQQYDDYASATDGRAFDNIRVKRDETPPSVLAFTPDDNSPVYSDTFAVEVTFSEPVLGVDATDLMLAGWAARRASVGSPVHLGGNRWRFSISGLINGTLELTLAPGAGSIQDVAGNSLAPLAWSCQIDTTLQFREEFPETTFSGHNWSTIVQAEIDSGGLDEPTAPYAARLNGHPDGSDSIETVAIDMSGFYMGTLRYCYERTGGGDSPEAGDDLVVAYQNSVGDWVELDRQSGGGPDMAGFENRTVSLPEEALHAEFRLRFSSNGNPGSSSVYDDWFLDDITIAAIEKGLGILLNSEPLTTESGEAAQFTVMLDRAPASEVTITLTSTDATEGIPSPTTLIFTPENWDVSQAVTVTGQDDDQNDQEVGYDILLSTNSADPFYDDIVESVSFVNMDDDVPAAATLPFGEDYSSGSLPRESWDYYSTGNGRIEVVSETLRMDASADDSASLNEAVVHVDLSQATGAMLFFDHTNPSENDEANTDGLAPGDTFAERHRNADMVAFSDDGTTWCVLDSLGESGSFAYDLESAVIAAGMALSDDFQIKFQQYGDSSWDSGGREFDNIFIRNGVPGLSVMPVSDLVTTEGGGTAEFSVVLDAVPMANVTIEISSGNEGEGIASPETLAFTPENWDVPQCVTVTGQDDDAEDENVEYVIHVATTSSDPFFNGLEVDVACINRDDEGPTPLPVPFTEDFSPAVFPAEAWEYYSSETGRIQVLLGALRMDALESTTYSLNEAVLHVDLSQTSNPTLSFVHNNPLGRDETHTDALSVGSVFTDLHRDADMVAVSDDSVHWCVLDLLDTDGARRHDLKAAAAAAGMTLSSDFLIKFQQFDNDLSNSGGRTFDNIALHDGIPGISLSSSSGLQTTEEGGTASFTVSLDAAPQFDVTLSLSSTNPEEGAVSPDVLVFTPENWQSPQTVTVAGQDDEINDNDVAYAVQLSSASFDFMYDSHNIAVSCINYDDEETIPVTIPHSEYFRDESLPTESWDYYSTGSGRIQLVSGKMRMDSSESHSYGLNEAVLHANLLDEPSVRIHFDHGNRYGDESHDDGLATGDLFTDVHRNADIVAFSDDGVTWCVLHVLDESDSFSYDLSAAVAAAGMTLTSDFLIKFQQYGDSAWGSGGREFDNVFLAPDTSQPTVEKHTPDNYAQVFGTVLNVEVRFSEPVRTPDPSCLALEGSAAASAVVGTPVDLGDDIWRFPITGLSDGILTLSLGEGEETVRDVAGNDLRPIRWSCQVASDILFFDDFASTTIGEQNWSRVEGTTVDAFAAFPVSAPYAARLNGHPDGGDILESVPVDLSRVLAAELRYAYERTGNGDSPDQGADLIVSYLNIYGNWVQLVRHSGSGVDMPRFEAQCISLPLAALHSQFRVRFSTTGTADPMVAFDDWFIDDVKIVERCEGVTVSLLDDPITTESGGTARFTVVLDEMPQAQVSVSCSVGDSTEGSVLPRKITFSQENWNVPQTVTVTGCDDAEFDRDIAYTVSFSSYSQDVAYRYLGLPSLRLTNLDDEVLGIGFQVPSSILEGEEGAGTVTIDPAIPFDLPVSLASSDPEALDVPSSVIIPAGQLSATFTMTGPWNDTSGNVQEVTISADFDDWGSASETVTIIDNTLTMAAPAALPTGIADNAYEMTFLAEGGEKPYRWRVEQGGWKEIPLNSGYLEGGYSLPSSIADRPFAAAGIFDFPFFGRHYSQIYVSRNGYVDLEDGSCDPINSEAALASHVRIAPLWDNLSAAGGEFYVLTGEDFTGFRWVRTHASRGTPVDVQLVLYRDGSIQFNYPIDHEGLTPTIGISAGNGEDYLLASIDGDSSIPAGTSLLFSPNAALPPGLTLDEETGVLSGTPRAPGNYEFMLHLDDDASETPTVSKQFQLEVVPFPSVALDLPERVLEDDGSVPASVAIPQPLNSDLVVTLDSGDDTEATVPETVTIPSGETTAVFDVTILDDGRLDGNQTVLITASSAHGMTGGEASFMVVDTDHPVLGPEPLSTPGRQNTVTWSALLDADEFYVEYSNDADFASPEGDSGWIADTSYEFNELADGETYYYRVKARKLGVSETESWSQLTQADFGGDTHNGTTTTSDGDVVLALQTLGETTITFEAYPGPDGVLGTEDDVPVTAPGSHAGQPSQLTDEFAVLGVEFLPLSGEEDKNEILSNEDFPLQRGEYLLASAHGKIEGRFNTAVKRISLHTLPGSAVPIVLSAFDRDGKPLGTTFLLEQENGPLSISSAYPISSFSVLHGTSSVAIDDLAIEYASECPSSGSLTSELISAPHLLSWGILEYTATTPAGTTLTVDVLSNTGAVLAANVPTGTDLNTLGITETAIQLRANLATTDPLGTPVLHDWNVGWTECVSPIESPWSNVEHSTQVSWSLPGDLDGDGLVGTDDLDIIRANWGRSVPAGQSMWGDADGDGKVGDSDLVILRANWGSHVSETLDKSGDGTPKSLTVKGDGIVEYHAVICGIANYEGTSNDLDYCDDDARDFRAALLAGHNWDSDNITMLIDAEVTEPAVQDAISQMGAAADADDVCVFFFSGHGTRTSDTAPMDESDGYDEALCVYSWSQSILDDELSDWIGALPTDKFAVIIDTCYSGGQIKSSGAKGIGGALGDEGDGFAADFFPVRTKDLADLGSGVVLAACREDEYSMERSTLRNGIFTYYLVQGMAETADSNGDGAVSAEESFDSLVGRVVQAEPSQHPVLFDGHPGGLRLVQYTEGFTFNGADSLVTSEDGGTASFTLALSSQPTAEVIVAFETGDTSEGTVLPTTLTFTPTDWSVPQSVTLTGVDDDVRDDDIAYLIHLSATSLDLGFEGLSGSVSCVNEDNEGPIPAAFPFTEDFASGTLPSEAWDYDSSPYGRIQVVSESLRMDSSATGVYALNEAILHVDLSQTDSAVLSFDHENPSRNDDADHGELSPGDLLSEDDLNVDMVAFSDDGLTWAVLHLPDWSGSFEYDLTFAAAAAGMSFSDDFRIKFQQYDDGPWEERGRGFDNISLRRDETPPSVVSLTPTQDRRLYYDHVDVEVTFSEPVADLDASSLILSGLAAGEAVVAEPVAVGERTWRFTVTGLRDGHLAMSLDSGIHDYSGNAMQTMAWGYEVNTSHLFFDDFAETEFSSEKWETIRYPTIDDVGQNEPSPPYSMRLDGHPHGNDYIESASVDLSSVFWGELHYAYERGGGVESPDRNEDLTVSFLDEGGNWVEVDRHAGEGPDMIVFETRVISLPETAFHENFRLRFKVSADSHSTSHWDNWFVDDVAVVGREYSLTGYFADEAATTEAGGTAQLSVVLERPAFADVTVAVSSGDETEGTVSPTTLTFTPANWNVPQIVTLTGQDDDVHDQDFPYIIHLASSSEHFLYDGQQAEVVCLNLDDEVALPATFPFQEGFSGADRPMESWDYYSDGTGRIQIVAETLRMDSGRSDTYSLNEAILHVDLSQATDPLLSFVHENPERNDESHRDGLTAGDRFTDAHRPADLVAFSDDGVTWCVLDLLDANGTFIHELAPAVAAAGMTLSSDFRIKFQQYDDSPWDSDGRSFDAITLRTGMPGLSVIPSAGMETTEAAGTAEFSVVLDAAPISDVTISVSSSDETEGTVAVPAFVFTPENWSVPQTATVVGRDDDLNDGDVGYEIRITATSSDPLYDGLATSTLCVNRDDDETTPAAFEFFEDFSAETLPTANWEYHASETGRTAVVSGTLRMDSSVDRTYGLNEAVLHIDLSGAADVRLEFDHDNSAGDEFHDDGLEAGDLFTESSRNADMVAFSDNGFTWCVLSLLDQSGFFSCDLGTAVAAAGMTMSSDFRIKFQQYDNASWPADGREFDNIAVVRDRTSPSVLARLPAEDDLVYGSVLDVEIMFSEAVQGVDASCLVVGGAAGAGATVGTPIPVHEGLGSRTWRFPIRRLRDGELELTLAPEPGTIQDLAGNDLPASTWSYQVNSSFVFVDGFASLAFDADKWGLTDGVTIEADGLNAPSAPYSVCFNGHPEGSDSLESVPIDLADYHTGTLCYAFERTGGGDAPEKGEDLVVSYQNADGAWVELDRMLGEGPDMSEFVQRDVPLPQAAFHPAVRFRFSSIGSASATVAYDEWFVDDVRISAREAALAVAPVAGLVTTESGGTASLTVVLDAVPLADVTVTLTSNDETEGVPSPDVLVFTPDNWDIPQTVTVVGQDDASHDETIDYVITATTSSSDPFFEGHEAEALCLNLDNDAVSPAAVPVAEDFSAEALPIESWEYYSNGTGRIRIVDGALRMDSSENQSYSLNEAVLRVDLSQTVNPTLLFYHENPSAHDAPHSGGLAVGDVFTSPHRNADMIAFSDDGVTWCVLDLLDTTGSSVYELKSAVAEAGMTLSSDFRIKFQQYDNCVWDFDGRAFDRVTVREGVPGMTLIPPIGLITSEGGGNSAFMVTLDAAPYADVTITLASSDETEAIVSPSTLTFTPQNWQSAQIVQVFGQDDDLDDQDVPYVISVVTSSSDFSYDGIGRGIACFNYDDDTPQLGLAIPSSILEGETLTGTLTVDMAPTTAVVVSLSSSDPDSLHLPESVTLLAGETTATFEISSDTNVVWDDTTDVIVSATFGDWNAASATITLTDNTLAIATPADLPAGIVNDPYRVTLASQGGTAPYYWSTDQEGWRETPLEYPVLEDGFALPSSMSDAPYWQLSPSFKFKFFSQSFSSMYVSRNGYVDFETGSCETYNSQSTLRSHVRIAPLWDDLSATGGEIRIRSEEDMVAIRWIRTLAVNANPVDAELVLYRNGEIQFNYRIDHVGLTPTIGISGLFGTDYFFSSLDGTSAIPAGTSILLSPNGALPPGLTLNKDTGELSGTPRAPGEYDFTVYLDDQTWGMPKQSKQIHLEVRPFPEITLDLPGDAAEENGTISALVQIAYPLDSDLLVSLSSDDTTEATVPETATIPAGETSATFEVSLVDDGEFDGDQRVRISASSARANSEGDAFITVLDTNGPTLAPEPPFTTGRRNVVTWLPLSDSDEYYVECDDDPEFGSPEGASGWFSGEVFGFDDLSEDQTYYYRVKARRLGETTLETWSQDTEEDFSDGVPNDVTITPDGDVVLSLSSGSYTSAPISPIDLLDWGTLAYAATVPAGTSLSVDVLSEAGTVLAADVPAGADLDLLGISDSTIRLRANLATTDEAFTPRLHDWGVTWTQCPPPVESAWSNVEHSTQVSWSFPGDLDGDGLVGNNDLNIIRAYWGQSVPAGHLLWGDATEDGKVNDADLVVVRENWGNRSARAPGVSGEDPPGSSVDKPNGVPNAAAADAVHSNSRAAAEAAWINALDALKEERENPRRRHDPSVVDLALIDWK